jgi:hypothetical protein
MLFVKAPEGCDSMDRRIAPGKADIQHEALKGGDKFIAPFQGMS